MIGQLNIGSNEETKLLHNSLKIKSGYREKVGAFI